MYLKELNQPTYPLPLVTIDLHKQRLSMLFSLAGLAQRYAELTSEPQLSDLMND